MIDSPTTFDEGDVEIDEEEEVSEEFIKLLDHSEREFALNDEVAELINMGTEDEKRELKFVDNPE